MAGRPDTAVIPDGATALVDGLNASRRAPFQLLARGVLLLPLAVMSACVIPTNLQEQSSSLDRPVIVASLAIPQFGEVVRTSTDTVNFTVWAEDESDQVHQLYARLFLGQADGTLVNLGHDTTLTPVPPKDPNLNLFSNSLFPEALPLCVAPGPGLYYVVVGNLPFCPSPPTTDCPSDSDVQPGGLTDQKYWDVQCQ